MSVYVSSSTANFRLDVGKFGQVYCDFNLSSGTVITSVGTLYNRITLIDSAIGVYLCQIVGPITTNNSSNIVYNTASVIRIRLNDTQTFSEYLTPASRTFRTLSDSSTSTDFLTNFYGSDLMEPTAALIPLIDAGSDTGSEDYLISP
jgi:hypothetical protein